VNHVVLSVGASKGRIQPSALAYLRSIGIEGQAFYGNSVGALNAAMYAAGKGRECEYLWDHITNRQVFKGRTGPVAIALQAAKSKPVLDLSPLAQMMGHQLVGKRLVYSLTVQTVDYVEGLRTHHFPAGTMIGTDLLEAVYTSAAIPLMFPTPWGADGGIINPIPLDAAINRADVLDKIIVISAHPVKPFAYDEAPTKELAKVGRAFDMMQAALVRASLEPFISINDTLRRMGQNSLFGWKRFNELIIAPDEPLPWGMLDFTVASKMGEIGRQLARKATL